MGAKNAKEDHMNIKQLAESHDIPLENVIKAFEAKGIEVVGK